MSASMRKTQILLSSGRFGVIHKPIRITFVFDEQEDIPNALFFAHPRSNRVCSNCVSHNNLANGCPALQCLLWNLFVLHGYSWIHWVAELNLVPRSSIDDCSEVHLLRSTLCDLLYSKHQIFLPGLLPSGFPVFFVLMIISEYSLSSRSITQIHLSFGALSSFGFSSTTPAVLDSERLQPILVQNLWPDIFWSGSGLNLCQSPPWTTCILLEASFSIEWILWILYKNLTKALASIYMPVIVNLFLHDVQISMSRRSNINILQWSRECFFLRHVELNSRFIVMTIDEDTLDRLEVGTGFSVICGFYRLRLSRFALKFSTEIFAPYGLFPPQSGFSEFVVSCWQFFLFHLVDAVPRWMFSVPDLLQKFWFVHLRLEK